MLTTWFSCFFFLFFVSNIKLNTILKELSFFPYCLAHCPQSFELYLVNYSAVTESYELFLLFWSINFFSRTRHLLSNTTCFFLSLPQMLHRTFTAVVQLRPVSSSWQMGLLHESTGYLWLVRNEPSHSE